MEFSKRKIIDKIEINQDYFAILITFTDSKADGFENYLWLYKRVFGTAKKVLLYENQCCHGEIYTNGIAEAVQVISQTDLDDVWKRMIYDREREAETSEK